MIRRTRSRRRAGALQRALERYERALASGENADDARREVAASLGEDAQLLSLAVGMTQARKPIPDPGPQDFFAAKLRGAQIRRKRIVIRRPALGWVPLGVAACTALFAAILVPSLRSLPGDPLYSVKTSAEDARVWFASGPAEARVRIGLANERFTEVERLIEREEIEESAEALAAGETVIVAAATDGIDDPEIAELIDATLAEAGKQIELAATILISHPSPAADLDALVKISQQGRQLAAAVADDLPNISQPPVLNTAVKLAKIEAEAKAARSKAEPAPEPPPCATPTPTPDPSASPAAEPPDNATSTAVESPSPTPTATPEPTPCTTPPPTPTPSPTPEPSPSVEPEPSPSPEPGSEQANNGRAGEDVGVFGSKDGERTGGGDPAADA